MGQTGVPGGGLFECEVVENENQLFALCPEKVVVCSLWDGNEVLPWVKVSERRSAGIF